jgi:hypothetical protein
MQDKASDYKSKVMKTNSTQQEILLVTTATFFKRQLCDRIMYNNEHLLSPPEQLEEACWNGLLNEILPEIKQKTSLGKSLYIWHIRNGNSFLQIELSELPLLMEKQYSIDTNFFLSDLLHN